MEKEQSWITEVYQEFWDKADELADKEVDSKAFRDKAERRDKHLDTMVAMFILMSAPEAPDDEDCEGNENDDCEECDQLPECRERWKQEARKN